jgi:hypothetical protein
MEYEQRLRVEDQELITTNYKEKNTRILIKKEKERKRGKRRKKK